MRLGTQEIGPLRCKCEDRSLCLQQLHRVEGGGLLLQSQCWGDRDWRDLGAFHPVSLGKSVSSGLRERLCLKNSGGE